jgi:hypothetical protein
VLVSSSVRLQWQELQDRHGSPGGIFRGFFYLIAFAMPGRRFPPPWSVEDVRLGGYQLISTPIIRGRNPIAFGSHALSVHGVISRLQ